MTDEHARIRMVPPGSSAYVDDDGRLIIEADSPHPVIGTVWEARNGEDVPDVCIVGVLPFSDTTIDVVVSAVDFSDELTDAYGERTTARSLPLDVLLEHWTRKDEASASITELLRKLERLG